MRIVKSFGAVGLGLAVAFIGFSSNDLNSASMGSIQSGTGKMTVLYDGKENAAINFGSAPFAPGDARSITVEVKNEGEVDFLSSMNSGDYPPEATLIQEMKTTVTDEVGTIVYQGSYTDLEVAGLDVPVGESEKLEVSVQWMPPENADLSVRRTGEFALNVTATQKI